MSIYLTVQHTYTDVQAGLFNNQQCIGMTTVHKHNASSLLIEMIKQLLQTHNINLTQLAFIALNQGPGPFTTLRVVISTMNGLSFAVGTPMIGIDGIKTLLIECNVPQTINIALLNAFNQDVYFAIDSQHQAVQTGYENIDFLLQSIKTHYAQIPLNFFGNGAIMHLDSIKNMCPNATVHTTISHCSLEALAQQALIKWQQQEYTKTQLQPLYLKNIAYTNSIKIK